MKKNIPLVLVILMITGTILYYINNPSERRQTAPSATDKATDYHALLYGNGRRDSVNEAASPASIYENFRRNKPLYLQDTDIPARFSVADSGDLVVNADVRDILDYFLLMRGDVDDQDIYTIILGYIQQSLDEPARAQATEVLRLYLAYLHTYGEWQQEVADGDNLDNNPIALKNRLLQLHELRARTLGESIDQAFFAEEEQVGLAYVDAKIALSDSSLISTFNSPNSEASRIEIVAALNAALPDDIRQSNEQAMRQVVLSETLEVLKAQGAGAYEIEQQRIAMVGQEANQRLKQVDAARSAWADKRRRYQEALALHAELQDMSMEALASIGEIQAIGLSDSELRRMQALDRIEKQLP